MTALGALRVAPGRRGLCRLNYTLLTATHSADSMHQLSDVLTHLYTNILVLVYIILVY
jgi:hypothetical protein